jgi:hypothetical protein
MYYRCPDSAYIQRFQAVRMGKNPSLPLAMLLRAIAGPLDKVFDGGLAKDDAAATSTTCSSTSPGLVLDTQCSPAQRIQPCLMLTLCFHWENTMMTFRRLLASIGTMFCVYYVQGLPLVRTQSLGKCFLRSEG